MSASSRTKVGDPVYVYALKSSGEVSERVGVVVKKKSGAALMLVSFNGGQRMCLSAKSCEIHNNVMWSKEPMLNVYVMKMVEVLLSRKDKCEEQIMSINKRLQVLKASCRNGSL